MKDNLLKNRLLSQHDGRINLTKKYDESCR